MSCASALVSKLAWKPPSMLILEFKYLQTENIKDGPPADLKKNPSRKKRANKRAKIQTGAQWASKAKEAVE
jgi:hypothetical protein